MKVYFLSDLHFGVRNSSHEWLDNQLKYFYDFFIPQVSGTDNILMIAGDVFDNRQSINIYILNNVLKLFKDLSNIFKEIHIITGNHDISNKTTNEINSIIPLSFIPGVFIYSEPKVLTINNKSFLMLPWANHKEHIILQKYDKIDYLVMHTDIASLKFNKYAKMNDGINVKKLNKFKYVFNGHIHFNQEKHNIIMLGSPYHMNRNDLENQKYFYILDTDTEKLFKKENNFSSKFIQIDLYDLFEYTLDDAKKIFNNNYVYIKIPTHVSFDSTINEILDELNNSKNTKIIYYDEDSSINEIEYDSNLSIENIIEEYISEINYDEETKEEIKHIIAQYKENLSVTID